MAFSSSMLHQINIGEKDMFGLFKQKVSKKEYGCIIAGNSLQHLDETSRGIDVILKEHSDIVKDTLVVNNNFEQIFSIHLISCIAVGELTFYSMDRNGISVYEVRNGYIEYMEELRIGLIQKHDVQLNIDSLRISKEVASIISDNCYLAKTGKFYCDEGFNQKDIYGQIAVYIFSLVTKDYPDLRSLIFEPASLNGALQLEMAIDRSFRFVHEMYKSYKLV